MSNEYDFESDVVNTEQTNNGPVNNGPVDNNNNGSNKGNGGVPLIAIIGIMALIIVGLIIYIIIDPSATKEEPVIDTQEYEYEVENEIEEEPVVDEEVEEIEEEKPVVKEDNVEDDEETKTPISVTTNSSVELSDDWMDCEFAVEGKKYKLNDAYKTYTQDDWYIDLEDMGYAEGYILNKNDKTYSTIDLLNDKFEDADVSVGFINRGDKARDITECDIWAINVDNSYSDTPISFELPGGIKNGVTLAEVEAAYGKPEAESDIYRSEDLGYTKYSYEYDYSIYFELTVYDEEGLVEFGYKIYE